jgi:hypothetical protein
MIFLTLISDSEVVRSNQQGRRPLYFKSRRPRRRDTAFFKDFAIPARNVLSRTCAECHASTLLVTPKVSEGRCGECAPAVYNVLTTKLSSRKMVNASSVGIIKYSNRARPFADAARGVLCTFQPTSPFTLHRFAAHLTDIESGST